MALTYIDPQTAVEDFEDMLNDEGPIYVAGYVFYPSDVLRECDTTAYREEFNNWMDMSNYTTDEQEAMDSQEDDQDE